MDSNSLLTTLMQLAERSKRNLRAAPGQIADQVSNFIPDFKGVSASVPAAVKNSAGKTDEEVFKKAIEETAGNAIPGGAGAAGIFAGPQGMARLKAAGLGDKMKEFTSRFFGQRAEINPTDTDLVIQAMLGGPHAVAKAKQAEQTAWRGAHAELVERAKAFPGSTGLQEAVAKSKAAAPKGLVASDFLEHFPELVIAYPRLKELPIEFYPSSTRGIGYAGKFDPEYAKSVRTAGSTGKGREVENAFYAAMGTDRYAANPDLYFRGRKVAKEAKKRANIKAREDSLTGNITIVGQANSDVPGVNSYNTLLHEIQHFIQREEAGMGKVRGSHFLDLYADKEGKRLTNYDRLVDKMNDRKEELRKIHSKQRNLADDKIDAADRIIREKQAAGKLTGDQASKLLNSVINQANKQDNRAYTNYVYATNKYQRENLPMHKKNWEYNMNPFEREAYESARRDIDPAYRKKYSRKTEVIK